MTSLKFHPAACLGPEDERVIESLAGSMRVNGYIKEHPLKLYEGKIADGRHRYRAAKIAKVTPTTTNIRLPKGMDITTWVLQAAHLRDITKTQKQCYVVKMNPDKGSGELAPLLGLSTMKNHNGTIYSNAVGSLQTLLKKRPDLFALVERGEIVKAKAMREIGLSYGIAGNASHLKVKQQLLDQIARLEAELEIAQGEIKALISQIGSEESCIWCDERFPHGPWCDIIDSQANEIDTWETLANANTAT